MTTEKIDVKHYVVQAGGILVSEHDTKSDATDAMYAAWYFLDGVVNVFVVDTSTGLGVNSIHSRGGVSMSRRGKFDGVLMPRGWTPVIKGSTWYVNGSLGGIRCHNGRWAYYPLHPTCRKFTTLWRLLSYVEAL